MKLVRKKSIDGSPSETDTRAQSGVEQHFYRMGKVMSYIPNKRKL